jgi:CRISPR-associated endonuclease/helicase Cas3
MRAAIIGVPVTSLLSHPHLLLSEHIAQMRVAAQAIWNRHSRALRDHCGAVWDWIDVSITFHDTGKGSVQFQGYIPAPDRYRGAKDLKAHTPLSLLCVLHHGPKEGWDWTKLLAVAAITAGHHSEFKTEEGLKSVCSNDRMIDVLSYQLEGLDWDALDAAIGLRLTRIPRGDALGVVSEVDELMEDLIYQMRGCPNRVTYRLRCQLAFSVLLEADKAFLAVEAVDQKRYLDPAPVELPPGLVDRFLAGKPSATVNHVRDQARTAFLERLPASSQLRIQTLALPTGTGKTLLGATWALSHRQRLQGDGSPPPKIVVVLPFLSIVDQTAKEYGELLKSRVGRGDLLCYHSLSERIFDPELDSKSQDFFLDTWQSDVIITTFDQLLLALLSPKTKHQLRFHNLADALIVLDEIQSVPCILWELLSHALTGLTGLGSTHILAMSATQPGFLPDECELIDEPVRFFKQMKRYRLVLRHRSPMQLSDFIAECRHRLPQWQGRRVLITLNTRRSARQVYSALCGKTNDPLLFITADRTPRDRLAAIAEIKNGEPCVVVSTQCVEAGVDIDMDLVIRDFAPLDSLIQIAGRCNRNDNGPRGTVEIVSLLHDESSCSFAGQIYDAILMQETSRVLEGRDTVDEEEIHALNHQYFDLLRIKKNLGSKHLEDWLEWRESEPIRDLLRGILTPQVAFVVVDQAPDLPDRLEAARNVPDRWEKKRALRALAPDVAQVSVSMYERSDLDPSDFADPFPPDADRRAAWFWLLRTGVYDGDRGLDLAPESDREPSWGMML